jgi:hypothetical protein
MPKLMRLNDIKDDSTLNDILNNEIIVLEDIQGSKIYVNWNGQSFTIKPKNLNSEPINMIDLAMQNYYNHAINFFTTLDSRVKGLLNKKWWFCFEYFPDNQPANIKYNRIPKNHLVLTSICKNNKFDYTTDELDEYSRLFGTDVIPVIFKGKLNEKVIEAIKYFLNTSEKDLEYVFGEKSFAYFFYKLLNPQTQNSFLMDKDFQYNIEKLLIRIDDKDVSFEILNPLYKRISDGNTTDFTEIYSLILVNFMNFCQSVDLDQIKLKGNNREEAYIYMICKLFNMYISEVKDDLMKFDFIVPEFFDKDKFRINTELIPNKLTKELISDDKKFEYCFKCVLGSFNKQRKKPIGVFTEATINIFNRFVQSLQTKIDDYFNKKSEIELTRSNLLDFGSFFDIKGSYDIDAEGNVYPDVFKEIEKGAEEKKKKMGPKAEIGKDGFTGEKA